MMPATRATARVSPLGVPPLATSRAVDGESRTRPLAVAVRVVGPPPPPAVVASGGIQRVALGLRRRLGPAGPTPAAQRHATTIAAIRAGWDALATSGSGSGRAIVAADADDVSAVIEALGDPGRDNLAPGSLRWLADRQDAPADAVGG